MPLSLRTELRAPSHPAILGPEGPPETSCGTAEEAYKVSAARRAGLVCRVLQRREMCD